MFIIKFAPSFFFMNAFSNILKQCNNALFQCYIVQTILIYDVQLFRSVLVISLKLLSVSCYFRFNLFSILYLLNYSSYLTLLFVLFRFFLWLFLNENSEFFHILALNSPLKIKFVTVVAVTTGIFHPFLEVIFFSATIKQI